MKNGWNVVSVCCAAVVASVSTTCKIVDCVIAREEVLVPAGGEKLLHPLNEEIRNAIEAKKVIWFHEKQRYRRLLFRVEDTEVEESYSDFLLSDDTTVRAT